jgi:hypothetical protein
MFASDGVEKFDDVPGVFMGAFQMGRVTDIGPEQQL